MYFFKKSFLISLLFPAAAAFGQQELMFHQMTNNWHGIYLNPSVFPENKRIAVGLPGYSMDAWHSGKFTLNDLFVEESGTRKTIDLGKALNVLEEQNSASYQLNFPTLSFGMKLKNGKWGVIGTHAIRYDVAMEYQKSLLELIWNGNAPFIGQTADVAPGIHFLTWQETGVGIQRYLNKATLGLKIKYLSGGGYLQTDDDHRLVSVYTNPDIYQLELKTDFAFRSALIVNSIDTSGLGFDISTNKVKRGKPFSNNSGIAFDLGATFKVSEKINIQASILDLGGKINWKDNAASFHSKGEWNYDGVLLDGQAIVNNFDSLGFEPELDTLNDIFKAVKTPGDFSSKIPLRIYVGGSYKVSPKLSVGVSLYHQEGKGRESSAAGLNVQYSPKKWLSAGLMYVVNERSASNLGFNLFVKPGPVQLFFASDNILKVLNPYGVSALSARGGASLTF